jgi:predicted ester cyclase
MLNAHDPDMVDQFVAVDYINNNPVPNGREANRAMWTSMFKAFPDMEATMEDLVISGDRVAGRFTYRGTHRGEIFGIPASGHRMEMRSLDIWRVADGQFVEHWDELNTLPLLRQFGRWTLLRALLLRVKRRLIARVGPGASAPGA